MKNTSKKYNIDTRVIHAGQEPDPTTGAVMTPIYATSTYTQKSPGVHQGFEYSRAQNPTRLAYERCMADIESGTEAFAFSSGMAAIATVLELLSPGDHIIAMNDIYGGTHRLLTQVRNRSSALSVSFADLTQENNFQNCLNSHTKMIWIETPSNPLLKIVDLEKICNFAKNQKLLLVVDNTFATPILQRPLEWGADIVIHSATKYLNGHSDVISGVAVVNDNALAHTLKYLQKSIGAIPSPFECFLVLRGLKTLDLRMERHCGNAMELAHWLEKHPKISKVHYPGLSSHAQHSIAKKQMTSYGGMISIDLKCNLSETKNVLERCELFTLAESLGGVESLIEHPALMTHATIPVKERQRLGITDGLIRLSIGIENVADLKKDLERALK